MVATATRREPWSRAPTTAPESTYSDGEPMTFYPVSLFEKVGRVEDELPKLIQRLENLGCPYEIRRFGDEHYGARLSGSESFHEGRTLAQVLKYALPDEEG